MKAWAIDGLKWVLIAYMIIQGAVGIVWEHSAPVAALFLIPGMLSLAKRLRGIGFLIGSLGQIVFLVGFQPHTPPYALLSQAFVALCMAWIYSMHKYLD